MMSEYPMLRHLIHNNPEYDIKRNPRGKKHRVFMARYTWIVERLVLANKYLFEYESRREPYSIIMYSRPDTYYPFALDLEGMEKRSGLNNVLVPNCFDEAMGAFGSREVMRIYIHDVKRLYSSWSFNSSSSYKSIYAAIHQVWYNAAEFNGFGYKRYNPLNCDSHCSSIAFNASTIRHVPPYVDKNGSETLAFQRCCGQYIVRDDRKVIYAFNRPIPAWFQR